ncbi:MAG: hypothetical protein H6R18_2578, partial [Proteobacteria bacterium]|nr:hypothetical protein [Pseudomonadota bacterium]
MKKSVLLVFFVAAISGCANFNLQPIDSKATASLKGQTVTHTNREMPDFAAMTPAKAAFGLFGAAAMISEGNKIIKENNVSNPADAIALNLTKFLEEKYGARLVMPSVPVSTDDLVQIASTANGKAKLVIDVQSGWSLAYFPTDWSHYRVMHTAKVRLIDTESKILVAEGFCKRIP